MSIYKVLIVEDAAFYVTIYKKILNPAHFELMTINRGAVFIKEALAFIPDIILMDVHLPDTNGVELCGELKANADLRSIPVIMVTSEEDVEVLKNAYKAGAVDYIKKPFNAIEMLIRMENVLKLSSQTQELVRIKQDTTVSEMGRAIAHNFNQPLTTLLGSAEMLRMIKDERELDDDIVELMDMMVESAEKISRLVQKVEKLKEYRVKDYLHDIKIIDFDQE
jgi:DNA-binding response OmpR family regulator